jgi:hypothetical protein
MMAICRGLLRNHPGRSRPWADRLQILLVKLNGRVRSSASCLLAIILACQRRRHAACISIDRTPNPSVASCK